jgi:hypothetical protein
MYATMTSQNWIVLLAFVLGAVAGALLISLQRAAAMGRISREFGKKLTEKIENHASLNDPGAVQNSHPPPTTESLQGKRLH